MIVAATRIERSELIDGPVESLSELTQSFRDIARANAFLGGTAAVRYGMRFFSAQRVLDVGCGAADIPLCLVKDARAKNRHLEVACLDANAAVLNVARTLTGEPPELRFVRGNGRDIPFADKSFDVAMCNLTLHHLAPLQAMELLRELRRVGRNVLVTDLYRSDWTLAGAWLFSRTSRNRLTRHDAPLSARRAYTLDEARDIARRSGWRHPIAVKRPFCRMVLYDDAAR